MEVLDGVVRAPCDGVVSFAPPKELAGELEVYRFGDVLATVGRERLFAPCDGFVSRRFAADGARALVGDGLLMFNKA